MYVWGTFWGEIKNWRGHTHGSRSVCANLLEGFPVGYRSLAHTNTLFLSRSVASSGNRNLQHMVLLRSWGGATYFSKRLQKKDWARQDGHRQGLTMVVQHSPTANAGASLGGKSHQSPNFGCQHRLAAGVVSLCKGRKRKGSSTLHSTSSM